MTTKSFIKTLILLPTLPVIASPLLFMVSLILTTGLVLSGLFVHTTSVFNKPAIAKIAVQEKKKPTQNSVEQMGSKLPETIKGASIVDADWVKANYLTRGITIFDVRGYTKYIVHIPGAIPFKGKEIKSKKKLPVDKGSPIVVYCDGLKSRQSYEVARSLARAGYKKIYWFRDGFNEWKSKGYSIDDNFS